MYQKILLLATLASALAVAADPISARGSADGQHPHDISVHVQAGALRGSVASNGVAAYLGIPYAAPPVGDRRWKPPVPVRAWPGTRPATTFGPGCPQKAMPGGFGPWTSEYMEAGPTDENCLFLNVWTPAKRHDRKLPVLLWFHGGGYTGGSGGVAIQRGQGLAAKGIVVVSVNYRLGALGFMAHPELTAESRRQASGNYGLMDQLMALKWARRNIEAFGGDPAQITIMGEFAGAGSVELMMASPLAKGLFARAIVMSNPTIGWTIYNRQQAEHDGLSLAAKAGARNLAELRALPAEAILSASDKLGANYFGKVRFAPSIDGYYLPDGADIHRSVSDVPVLTGMTADELGFFDPRFGQMDSAGFEAAVRKRFGVIAKDVLSYYPHGTAAEAAHAGTAQRRDGALAALANWADRRLAASRQPHFLYLWSRPQPGPIARYGAFHSGNLAYVFATLAALPSIPFTDEDRSLSVRASDYWVNFVATGNPNGAGLPSWQRYRRSERQMLEFGTDAESRAVLPPRLLELYYSHVASGGTLSVL